MIRLTQKEKADRFDALQAAINLTIANYAARKRTEEQAAARFNAVENNSLYALHMGEASVYGAVIEDLKRWV